MSGLTIDQSKNEDKVFDEIKLRYMRESDYHKWTITDFTFDPPSDADFYDNLKTGGNVGVKVKYEDGFKVYLIGDKADGGWTEMHVGSLPGSPAT